MQRKFTYINEFNSIKNDCIFCGTKLNLVFTTFFGVYKPGIPLINAWENNGSFNFKFEFNSASSSIISVGHINTLTNEVKFESENKIEDVIKALESLSPHVELQCTNKKCKMNYYLCSHVFRFDRHTKYINFYVQPFELDMECFTVDKLWIHNDYHYETTSIYQIEEIKANKPISVPMIDFNQMTKTKIVNRIKTLVTFS